MVKEIGSEFHDVPFEDGSGMVFPRPGSLVFSGRTAIEEVLKRLPDLHTALLPSYCCDSMTEPFRRHGKEVLFYDVFWDEGLRVRIDKKADILLWCNYFGFRNEMPEFDGVIMEDVTHGLLSDHAFHERSNYLVASLRKWEPIYCGGYCSVITNGEMPPMEFLEKKKSAMELKSQYLADLEPQKKTEYLSLFEESNQWIKNHYGGLSIDQDSKSFLSHVNVDKQREIRRRNARVLYDLLKDVEFLFPEEEMDCPLFVPILLPKRRDEIRKHLIQNKIYCPVHWPRPNAKCDSNLYDLELSLICDQRYGEEDMERMAGVLKEIL